MYYISLKVRTSCSTEFREQLLKRGFSIDLVGRYSLERNRISSPKIVPLPAEDSYFECIANLKGDCNFPDFDMLKFLHDHRHEFRDYEIGSLPF